MDSKARDILEATQVGGRFDGMNASVMPDLCSGHANRSTRALSTPTAEMMGKRNAS